MTKETRSIFYVNMLFRKSGLLAVILTLLLTPASMAQPAGGSPGPGPTQPWIINGNTIRYPGQIISPILVNPICIASNGVNEPCEGGGDTWQALTITATNTLSQIASNYSTGSSGGATIYYRGQAYTDHDASSPFTVSAGVIAWSATNTVSAGVIVGGYQISLTAGYFASPMMPATFVVIP